jgi:membrane carboxypeptidase/penicillin-binding protein PbpC
MAQEAGVYEVMWRADEYKITHAKHMIYALEEGIKILEDDPEYFRKFEPENGWGNYEGLLGVAKQLLELCVANPEATVEVSR